LLLGLLCSLACSIASCQQTTRFEVPGDAAASGDGATDTGAVFDGEAGGPDADAPDADAGGLDSSADEVAPADSGDAAGDVVPDDGAFDAAIDVDATGPVVCTVVGVRGECLPAAECAGETTAAPDQCPTWSDGLCCTPSDAVRCSVEGVPGECLDVADCFGDRHSTPGFCPGPAEIQCCTANDPDDPPGSCDPEAMPRPNAGLEEEAGEGGCAAGMVRVDDFCIDRFEASLVEVFDDGRTVTWSPYHNPGERRVRAVSLRGAVPQGYITGEQAARACDEAEKRLCDDDEWLRACRGAGLVNVYPYGLELALGTCNDHRDSHPVVEYFGTTADWIWSQLGNACINQLPDSLALTGEFSECVTAEGVYDLVGNLHEWTADPAGTFRGGFYVDTWRNGPGCLYATTAHNIYHWDYSTGFRCCADPSGE
jgi:hypothetical protein